MDGDRKTSKVARQAFRLLTNRVIILTFIYLVHSVFRTLNSISGLFGHLGVYVLLLVGHELLVASSVD